MGFTFTPNTPQPNTFPANDQPLINQNFQYINSFANVDHNFSQFSGNPTDGYHDQVTFNQNQTTPGFVPPGVSVMYANTGSPSGSQLFFNNAAGNVQLTTVIASVPTKATNGCSFLPGGILIQWGQAVVAVGGTVTFPVAFSAPAYSVVLTLRTSPYNISASKGYPSAIPGVTGANFVVGNNDGTAQTYTFSWMAIGPA